MSESDLEFVDTHTHLATDAFASDRNETLERAAAAGVRTLIAIGAGEQMKSNRDAIALAKAHANIFATVGIHPHDASVWSDENLAQLRDLAQNNPKVRAIGEIGLDYHYLHSPKEIQQKAFEAQIQLAHELNLPLIIHTREAEEDTFAILKNHQKWLHKLVIHCFTGSPIFAENLKTIDAYLGIGGVITFRSADAIREVVAQYPLEKLLLETDCPYLAPIPHRGQRNEPTYIPLIAGKIAEMIKKSLEEIAQQTTENAFEFFTITDKI